MTTYLLISKILQYDFPFVVRQAHHERKIILKNLANQYL
jgi:hypothetical protein